MVNSSYAVNLNIIGNSDDVQTNSSHGIMMLGGGDDVDTAFKWMAKKSGNGDLIIISTTEKNISLYSDYLQYGFDSVETVLIDSQEKANSIEINNKLLSAEAVFIPGGDQNKYILNWKETKLIKTLEYLLLDKKIPIGGTSAGMAILGEFYYAPREPIAQDPLLNPLSDPMNNGLGKNFINIDYLKGLITDTHYSDRNRQNRHISFMALLQDMFDLPFIKGIGLDEKTALCIEENGVAEIHGSGNAYFHISLKTPECCEPNKPLHWGQEAIKTYIGSRGNKFNLNDWDGLGGIWKYFNVLEGKIACNSY
jgi:cyanophycinase